MEPDEREPEVHLAQPLVEHPAGHLREPEVHPAEHREHDRAEQHVVEVRHDEVRVRDVPVDRRRGEQYPGQAAEQERGHEAERPQHRGLERQLPPPHGADPVEELDPGRYRDQERQEREERQQHLAGGEHVVRPYAHRQRGDPDRRGDHALVPEQRLAAEHRDDLGDDAEERQRHDVDLGMAEEPEQVLPQQRVAALGRIEEVRVDEPVHRQHRAGHHDGRHGEDDHERGHEHRPHEQRHPVERHARTAHLQRGDDELDGGHERGDLRERDQLRPDVDALARRVGGARQRDVREPAGVRSDVERERRPQHEAAEEIDPVPEVVHAREGDVARADHERHEVDAERLHHRHREQEHHRAAVHREDLVVEVGADEAALRARELQSHERGEHAAEREEAECRHDVAQGHGLVARARQPSQEARRRRPDALERGAVQRLARGLAGCERARRADGRAHESPPRNASSALRSSAPKALPGICAPGF